MLATSIGIGIALATSIALPLVLINRNKKRKQNRSRAQKDVKQNHDASLIEKSDKKNQAETKTTSRYQNIMPVVKRNTAIPSDNEIQRPIPAVSLMSRSAPSAQSIMHDHQSSILKIEVTYKIYDHQTPWSAPFISMASGSGFIIKYGDTLCVVTNAHVVNGAVTIHLRLPFQGETYRTSMIAINDQCDCALLKLPQELFNKVEPLRLYDKWLDIGETVYVLGFPQLGEEISITSGVVARQEIDEYAHSGWHGLQYGISAAINPGNSGGAALNTRGELIGIPFQGSINNQGFIIPVEVLQHFINNSLKNKHTGFPHIGISYQSMENPLIRQHHYLTNDQSGVLVTHVPTMSSAFEILQSKDVIQSIDGNKVSNEGRIYHNNTWIDLEYLFQNKSIGDTIQVEFLRNGKKYKRNIPLSHTKEDLELIKWVHKEQPTYMILSGVVFKVLTINDLKSTYSPEKRQENSEIVVIHKVLNSQSTIGYRHYEGAQITQINKHKIRNMNDVITYINEAQQDKITVRVLKRRDSESFHHESQNNRYIVIPNIKKSKKAWQDHLAILRMYDIREACSHNLKIKMLELMPSQKKNKKKMSQE